jgi:exodeoxyribonuclease V alpha subunit
MTSSVDDLFRAGVISRLDAHFARSLGRLVRDTAPPVLVGAAMASRAVRLGHVCADLERLHDAAPVEPVDAGGESVPVELPGVPELLDLLAKSRLVGSGRAGEEPRPLVLTGGHRLYLHRYFHYEQRLTESLRERAAVSMDVDESVLRASLARLFDEEGASIPRQRGGEKQRLAALMVALRGFAVISGGPGTGKTYTVAKVLALLQEQARAQGREFLRIRLLAPTGKAAQRLGESIQNSVARLACDDAVKAAIPREAATLHRALGYRPHTPTQFSHDAENPLPADLVLVDEASMVDLALMAKLVDAVPRSARLVLVGDKDQLASVEAGAILGDIYGSEGDEDDGAVDGYSAAFANRVERITGVRVRRSERVETGIQDCRIHLTVSRRYAPDSGIALLAGAVNSGDAMAALETLHTHADVALRPLDEGEGHTLEAVLGEAVMGAFRDITRVEPEARLALLDRFRILCAHRKGRFGVVAVNAFVEQHLREHGALEGTEEWYDGRPVIITENDYQLDLFNGDIGIICVSEGGQTVEACFPGQNGAALRRLPPARLPPHETVFAMTVHKSQGSEFDRVALLLPETESRLLTRELLYTGITRAKTRVDVFGSEGVLAAGIGRRVQRASGLREGLWGRVAQHDSLVAAPRIR